MLRNTFFDFLARYLRVSLLRTALTIDCTELFSASLLCALKKIFTEVCFLLSRLMFVVVSSRFCFVPSAARFVDGCRDALRFVNFS